MQTWTSLLRYPAALPITPMAIAFDISSTLGSFFPNTRYKAAQHYQHVLCSRQYILLNKNQDNLYKNRKKEKKESCINALHVRGMLICLRVQVKCTSHMLLLLTLLSCMFTW